MPGLQRGAVERRVVARGGAAGSDRLDAALGHSARRRIVEVSAARWLNEPDREVAYLTKRPILAGVVLVPLPGLLHRWSPG